MALEYFSEQFWLDTDYTLDEFKSKVKNYDFDVRFM